MSKKTDGYERGLRGHQPGSSPGLFQSREEWEGQQEGYRAYLLQEKQEQREEQLREEEKRRRDRETEHRESEKLQEKYENEPNLQIVKPVALRVKKLIESELNSGMEIRTESKVYGKNLDKQWTVSECYLLFDPSTRFRDRLVHIIYNSDQRSFYFEVCVHKRGFRGRRPENGWYGGVLFQEYKGCEVSDTYIKDLVRYVLNYRRA
ncbi:MAG: hypothetical protein ABR875_00220 [Minisyncoccia bacterium]|jgi:hypothetical protein